MTNEEAINTLKSLKDYYNDKNEDSYVGFDDEDNEALDIAIKALEQQTRDCKTCKHSDKGNCAYTEECHECMWESKYEQQPSEIHCEFSDENVAKAFIEDVEAVKDKLPKSSEDCRNCKKWNECSCGKEGYENGTSIGYSIGECKDYEPYEDAISRAAMLSLQTEYAEKMGATTFWELRDDIRGLPPVKPKYTDEEIDKAQTVEQAYVDKMVELAVEEVKRPKGKWIKTQSGDEDFPESIVCSRCKGENSHIDFNEHGEPIGKIFVMSKYCPNCGAYMDGGEE